MRLMEDSVRLNDKDPHIFSVESMHSNMRSIGVLVVIFVICYAYELTNFNFSIDEELLASASPSVMIGLGRWTNYLVWTLLWPQPVTPFGPFLLFGLFGSIGYVVLLRAFDIDSPSPSHLALFPIFIAFPVWFTQVEFSTNIIGDGIALLACCGAAFFSKAPLMTINGLGKGRVLSSTLCAASLCAAAIGAYQSFVFLYIVLGVAVTLYISSARDNYVLLNYTKSIFFIAVVAISAYVGSFILSKIVMTISNVPLSPYAQTFLKLDELYRHPDDVLCKTANQFTFIYFMAWAKFGHASVAFAAILFFGAAALLLRRRSTAHVLVSLASLVLISVAPFGFHPFLGGDLPVRAFVAVPAVVWLFLFLPLLLNNSPSTQRFVLLLSAVAFIHIVYVQSIVQARAWAVQKHDLLLAASIHDRIIAVLGADADYKRIKVDFFGMREPESIYPFVSTSSSGASFFEWDAGNPDRIVAFMNMVGFSDLVVAPLNERQELTKKFAAMPIWPAAGAVKVDGHVVLVRLSEKALTR